MFLEITKPNLFKRLLSFTISFIVLFFATISANTCTANAATSVKNLKIIGSQLSDNNGNAVQLKGVSSHGLQWYGDFINYDSMKFIRDNWGANVVRAAMYTDQDGYISNPERAKSKVKEIVNAAIDLNMYVIIDWHILNDYDPNMHKEESKSFFEEMAKTYGNYPNVIYEICNEPNGGVSWNNSIKPYAEYIIPAIRAIDPDNIIIVGTSTWSQDVDTAANDPLSYSNIMYAFHFYAGTHGQSLRDKVSYALNKGAAVFVSEWGCSDASGNGGPYINQSQEWVDFMDKNKLSWCSWSLSDKWETSALLKSGASKTGGWSDSNLTTSGLFIKNNMKTTSDIISDSETVVPSKPETVVPSKPETIIPSKPETNNGTTSDSTNNDDKNTSSDVTNNDKVDSDNTNTDNSNTSTSNIEVEYKIVSDWGCGANVNVTIKNNGTTPINNWKMSWTNPSNQSISNMWTASFKKTGSTIATEGYNYNSTIGANGGTVSFGFTLNYNGKLQVPTNIKVNGVNCKVK